VAILHVAVVFFCAERYLDRFGHPSLAFETAFTYPFLRPVLIFIETVDFPQWFYRDIGCLVLAWIAVVADGMFRGVILVGAWHIAQSVRRRAKQR
jgi:hypothetical protein